MRLGKIFTALGCILLVAISGCSSSLQYKAGLYTKSVTGVIKSDHLAAEDRPFVLVQDFHRTLVETSDGYLNRVTAFIAYPDKNGNYVVPFDSDSVKLELTYYAYNSLIDASYFSRSLGIGSYQYDVDLKEDKNWKRSYYLLIKPVLIEFITEKRYRMSESDKYFLGQWLSNVDDRL